MIRASMSSLAVKMNPVVRTLGNRTLSSMSSVSPIKSASIEELPVMVGTSFSSVVPSIGVILRSIVEIKRSEYLMIDKDVLWVTQDEIEKLMIMSNVDWVIT